jgi:hypothetical protein
VDDNRRSSIPRHDAAARAVVHAFGERLLGDSTAVRTFLGSATRIDCFHKTTSICSFVIRERDDLTPRGIVDVLGEHPSRQAFDVEIFEGDPAKTGDQIAGNLVAEVPALGRDMSLKLGERGAAFAADFGAALAPRERPLSAAKALGCLLRPAWARDHFAVAQRHKRGQAKINTNAVRPSAFNRRDFDVKDHVPFPGLPGQDRGFWLGRQFAVPADLYFARNTNETKLAGLSERQSVANAELRGMVAVAGAETGEPMAARKERSERLLQTPENLLQGREGPASEFWKLSTDRFKFIRLVLVPQRNAASPVRSNALIECGVVQKTEIAKHFAERYRLRFVRFYSEFVRQNHRLMISCNLENFNRERAFLPGLNAGVSCAKI